MDPLEEMTFWTEKETTHPDGTTEHERQGIEIGPEEIERFMPDPQTEEE